MNARGCQEQIGVNHCGLCEGKAVMAGLVVGGWIYACELHADSLAALLRTWPDGCLVYDLEALAHLIPVQARKPRR